MGVPNSMQKTRGMVQPRMPASPKRRGSGRVFMKIYCVQYCLVVCGDLGFSIRIYRRRRGGGLGVGLSRNPSCVFPGHIGSAARGTSRGAHVRVNRVSVGCHVLPIWYRLAFCNIEVVFL